MSLLGRVIRSTENTLVKNWSLGSAVSWNDFSKKVELPVPPKRPLSSYMLFIKENRKEILKENPALSNTEQIKLLAKKWGSLSIDCKKPYEEQARENTLLYGEQHKMYYENLSDQQKQELMKQKSEKFKARRMNRLNKALRESGLPKHPKSSYALFVHSLANADKSDLVKSKDFIKHAAEKWKALSETERKTFEKQAADDKERYLLEMAAWREKLLKEGKEKLLLQYTEFKHGGKSSIDKIEEAEEKKVTKSKKTKSTKEAKSAT